MTAKEAKKLALEYKETEEQREYDYVMNYIKKTAAYGGMSMKFSNITLRESNIKKLTDLGYTIKINNSIVSTTVTWNK